MSEHEALINRAIEDGRIPPDRADHYRQMLDADPIRGGAIIAALQPVPKRRRDVLASAGTIPIEDTAYPEHWIPDVGSASGPVTFEDPAMRSANADAPSHGRMGRPLEHGYGLIGRQGDNGLVGREH